jgi:heterodisulfide reductase subunit B2
LNVSYYPGCCMHGTAKGYDQSIQAVSGALGVSLVEVDGWTCCGASSAHATDFELSVALPARNLMAAQKRGLDVMVPCAACFNRFKAAEHHLREDPDLKARIEEALQGRIHADHGVCNSVDFFVNHVGLDPLREKVSRKLTGLKVASYYGCLLVRPPAVCGFDDPENPTSMDRLVEALGAEARPWSFKTDCCGGALTVARTEQVVRLVDRLVAMAREAGANCLVTACPECMANLDMRATRGMPIFYFSELMGLAMGVPGADKWLKFHQIDPMPLLRQAGIFL